MRAFAAVFLFLPLAAQEPAPSGLLTGRLLEWEGSSPAGELTFRTSDNRVLRCAFDSKTLFERDRLPMQVSQLAAGDHLELVTDRQSSPQKCYLRAVYLVPAARPKPPANWYRPRFGTYRPVTEAIFPRGNLTFSGVVLRINPERLVLRTRSADQQVFLLREDTRYLDSGSSAQLSELRVNTRVFIRAGKNLEGDIEAYQIVWGEISGP